jgi:hypothetical protein
VARAADFSGGALWVELNAGHVSSSLVDASGNPIESFHIPCVTDGKTSDLARSAVRKAAAEIAKPQQDVQLPDPVAAGALELLEGVLLSPEPTAEELQ